MPAPRQDTMIRGTEEGEAMYHQTRVRPRVGKPGKLRWLRRPLAATIVAVTTCLLGSILAAPALADWGFHTSVAEGHPETPVGVALAEAGQFDATGLFSGQIYELDLADEPVPPSPFEGGGLLSGVAVNPLSHNVYVVDASELTIEVFNPATGQLERSFVIPGTGNLFGAYTVVQIAADSHGNVYVPNAPGNDIEVFNEEGEAPEGGVAATIAGAEGHALKGPEGVAVDSSGNIWVADTGDGRIEEFEPDGSYLEEIASPHVQAVAVGDAGDVFASIGGEGVASKVIEYGPTGTQIAEFGAGVLSEDIIGISKGIAVDSAHELVYVADTAKSVIQRFTNWAASTAAPSNVAEGQATLNGTVDVEAGAVSTCKFEYGTTTSYGSSASCSPGGSYTTTTPVTATLSELAPGVDYHYRISATGAGGFTQVGHDQEFGPPAIDSESAEAIVTTATPRARVTLPMQGQATCTAQYVEEAEYVASGYANATLVPCTAPIGNTPGEYLVETKRLEGLQPNTVYHYRFLTANEAGTLTGPDAEFATFGIKSFASEALGQAGEQITQAGAHPYEWTDTFRLNASSKKFANGTTVPIATDANPKDIVTELPPGLIGNPDATPKCAPYDVAHADCSGATQVGVMEIATANPNSVADTGRLQETQSVPIYNLVPPKGLAAQFGARFNGYVTVHIDSKVRTGGDYGVTAEVLNNSTAEGVVVAQVTLWGVPSAESHDPERYCPSPDTINEVPNCAERGPLIPFLSNPTACTGEREARMTAEPWQEGELDGRPVIVPASATMPPITGCSHVHFTPSMVVQPTAKVSDSPTGLHVELTVPQNESPTGLAEADLKDASVTLPAGVTVNPSSANGMVGCPLLTGTDAAQEAKEANGEISGINMHTPYAANCPNASKIGSVRIKTPLLEEELVGGVYVAQQGNAGATQGSNPFGSLLALYIAAEAPERGVVIKLAGHVELNPSTGQLTTTFDENPQLPFEVLKLDFFGGERAPLATPRTCGSYQPAALLEPWSHQPAAGEAAGTPDAEPFIEPFAIGSAPNGIACGASPFSPGFEAGTASNQAGGFGSFVMNLARKDGEQRLSTVSMTMPKGLAGMLSKVALCDEAQANAGTCPAASKIGHVVVQAGVGSEPVTLPQAGKPQDPVYITKKYEGAPFGLSIVVPAEAGPFDLGTVVVRAKIYVNPHTAQVTVVSNPMPQMLQGIPLDVKTIHVDIDRPGFMFNPTSCTPTSVNGTIGSAEGANAAVNSRFQAAGCRGLEFKPHFSAEIHAHHSRKRGEYLHVAVTSTFGQANIGKVHVQLPKKLPSEEVTLKQACTEAQFAKDPEGCPAGSKVGYATAHTPILPVPLTGPAIFVSHGGAAFPNLDLLLKGDGVDITLVGLTDIKHGITTSTFATVPDVPVSRFDLVLPQSTHPALGANGNMCVKPLYMPTRITGQNGAVIQQRTRIKVHGCKPEIHVVGHRVKGAHAVIRVSVPSAGKLIASGRGIERSHKRVRRKGTVKIDVTLGKHGARVLAANPHQRVNAKVKLRFLPKHGVPLAAQVKLLLR